MTLDLIVIRIYNNFQMEYKIIDEDRYQEVLEHLKQHFFADEPLNKATDLCSHVKGQHYMEQQTIKTLRDEMSLMAISSDNQVNHFNLPALKFNPYAELTLDCWSVFEWRA